MPKARDPRLIPNKRLRYQRQLRGWSQSYLAQQIDVPAYYISRWERGEVLPSPYYQQQLCELFGKTAEELGMLPAGEDASEAPAQQKEAAETIEHLEDISGTPESQDGASEASEALDDAPELRTDKGDEGGALAPAADEEESGVLAPAVAEEGTAETALDSAGASIQQEPGSSTQQEPARLPIPAKKPVPETRKPLPFPLRLFYMQQQEGGRWRPLSALLLILVTCGLIVATLVPLLMRNPNQQVAQAPAIVGQLSFLSSGHTTETSNQGIADEVELTLRHLSSPAPGKSYYAWLLPDVSQPEGEMVLLGKLAVQGGTANLMYKDPQRTNLLATASRFLVTEEDAAITPLTPSIDQHTWRYSAAIPQTHVSGQEGFQYSYLDHLRHLLALDPDLDKLDLRGGVTIWLYRNTQSIQQWASGARDSWKAGSVDANAIRQQAIRILEYLDGIAYVQLDAPPGKTLPLLVDQHLGLVPLLQLTTYQQPPAYLYHVNLHLIGMSDSPDASATARAQILQIITAIKNVNAWLGQVRQDARQLVAMSDQQVQQQTTLSLLNDLATYATYAFAGQSASAGGSTSGGVSWIWQRVQSLATMDITVYTSQNGQN